MPPTRSATITLARLGRIAGLLNGESRSFANPFAVHRGETAHVHVNFHPHIGVPLDWAPDRFLTTNRRRIICSSRDAGFDIATGACLRGPCLGDCPEAVMIRIEDGVLLVPEDAGL